MKRLNMDGSYYYTSENIDKFITKKLPGNYALGYRIDKKFKVQYVGRSDHDVAAELKTYLHKNYKRFKYSYASSSKTAFKKECKNYHDFKNLDNIIHPARPVHTDWHCPICHI